VSNGLKVKNHPHGQLYFQKGLIGKRIIITVSSFTTAFSGCACSTHLLVWGMSRLPPSLDKRKKRSNKTIETSFIAAILNIL
jgi:hypothetical protein